MKIRTKVISLLALLFAGLIVVAVAIQKQVLMPSFAVLEREDATTSMKRIVYALGMTQDSLQLTAVDWGNWADVFDFVQSPNSAFVETNITPIALKQLQVDALLIVDSGGTVVLSSARDPLSGGQLTIDFLNRRTLPQRFPWRSVMTPGSSVKGMIDTDRGVMLIAAAPILNGSGGGQSRGLVIMGKLLNAALVQRIGAQAQAAVTLREHRPTDRAQSLSETDAATQVERSFDDIYGSPLMTLEVSVPRKITEQGRSAVNYASLYLIGAGIAVLLALVVLLNRIVLTPLARVTAHAVSLGDGTDLTPRLDLPGSDEVSSLAREFDRMVERLAQTRRQLVDQSFQSGFAELAKGVLHNLGNAMTPLGVRVTHLSERLRQAPIDDLQLAVAELAGESPGTQRFADLQEFLRLGCCEMASLIRETQLDSDVIQRQSTIVQTALSELMRSTRNEHVVESVRLSELVSQTLEIVPDACRQRLIVDSDDSLRRIGPVTVARTVLRLVLQNLVINAADAIRDAGRERGVLRVSAEIVREAHQTQLHLHCADNGVGITADNLSRVFEQGFSTKSLETNYGIGLHWCANAIAALGGRIWAASEGPGRGASMHLILPLTGG